MHKSLNPYQNTQVTTAAPEKILIMLYDGAIKFTLLAQERLKQNDLEEKGLYIGKALAIISELMVTLNHEIGGEIAANLEKLYIYLIGEYTSANLNNDMAPLDNALKIMSLLRDTWVEASEISFRERNELRQEQRALSVG
jgi:flagellar protein FliS